MCIPWAEFWGQANWLGQLSYFILVTAIWLVRGGAALSWLAKMLSFVSLWAKCCTSEGQKSILSHLVFLKSTEQGIKASHLGISKLEDVRNGLNLLNAQTEITEICDLGDPVKKRHLFWFVASRFLSFLSSKQKLTLEKRKEIKQRELCGHTLFSVVDVQQDAIFNWKLKTKNR